MDRLLISYEHEAIFSAYMLTLKASENAITSDEINNLQGIKFTTKAFLDTPGKTSEVKDLNRNLTLVEAAINHSLLSPIKEKLISADKYNIIYSIEEDGLLTKKNLDKLTVRYWNLVGELNNSPDNEVSFWDGIHELDKFFLEMSAVITYCSPSFDLQDFVVRSPEITSFKKNLIKVEPFIAFHQNMMLFEKISDEISRQPDNILNTVFNSGARLKSVQLLKAASNTGIPTDIYGKAFPDNIENSLLDGLSPKEYFLTGDSARLALAQRQEAIPKGGELQRKFFFTVGILKLDREVDDCHTAKYFNMLVKNKFHLQLLNHRWYRNSMGEEVQIDINDGSLVGRTLQMRSPITCQNKDYKICGRCLGDKHPSSVNLGSLVGAALSEGIIQSVLRAHHFGGAFIAVENEELFVVLRRSSFIGPDTVVCTPEDANFIKEYLYEIYSEEENEIEFSTEETDTEYINLKIKVNELPFNDDSVKVLNSIVGLIDRNRDAAGLIQPSELYDRLEIVIEQNGILSSYLELVLSLLYYDEDGILLRYSEKEPQKQVALKNVVELLDPKLSIFYNFSNRIISKIYNHKPTANTGEISHMYLDLIDCYH